MFFKKGSINKFVKVLKKRISGDKIKRKSFIGSDSRNANNSGYAIARDFGRISPKIRINIVTKAVAKPTPKEPKAFTAKAVTRVLVSIFTILFPINIPVKNVFFFLRIVCTLCAATSFFSTRYLSFSLDTERKAVSQAEKNIDSNSNSTKTSA